MPKKRKIPDQNKKVSSKIEIPKPNHANIDERLRLSFERFAFTSLRDKEIQFNNYYRDDAHALTVLVGFISGFMREMSSINRTEFLANISKKSQLHIHKIANRNIDKVQKLLELYGMPSMLITQWVEGEHIYQVEAKSDINAARVVCTLSDCLLYPLFLDVNHHVYLNIEKTKDSGSIDFHFCPRNDSRLCESGNNGFCFFGQYLDLNKINKSFEYDVTPNKK